MTTIPKDFNAKFKPNFKISISQQPVDESGPDKAENVPHDVLYQLVKSRPGKDLFSLSWTLFNEFHF